VDQYVSNETISEGAEEINIWMRQRCSLDLDMKLLNGYYVDDWVKVKAQLNHDDLERLLVYEKLESQEEGIWLNGTQAKVL